MRILEYEIPEEYSGRPLIHFLRGYIKFSTHIVQTLRHTEGAVEVNEKSARVVDKVFSGDRILIRLPEKTSAPLHFEMELDIIYEDDDILIINKPAGVSVHPTRNHPNGTLANAVSSYINSKGEGSFAARAIGRLDKGTSGAILFAKNIFAASRLNGKIEKIYIAIAYGELHESGTIDTPIYRPDPKKTLRATGEYGDSAVTHWRVLKNLNNETLIEVNIETGRTHQIRVHMASVGAPLVGDDMYGAPLGKYITRPALHCKRITFIHPVTNEVMTFEAEIPADMKNEIEHSSKAF